MTQICLPTCLLRRPNAVVPAREGRVQPTQKSQKHHGHAHHRTADLSHHDLPLDRGHEIERHPTEGTGAMATTEEVTAEACQEAGAEAQHEVIEKEATRGVRAGRLFLRARRYAH